MKRTAEFLRSVMPADPFQLFFLAGIVCLVVAHGLRWWPVEARLAPNQLTDWFGRLLQAFGALLVYPIIFAATAGYFVCFWPGSRPVRRILGFVFLPAIAGLGLLLTLLAYLIGPSTSVFESTGSMVLHRFLWIQTILWKLSGFQFSLAGLLLIAIFTSRLAFGIATLPLALPEEPGLESEDVGSWHRLRLLIWFLVSLVFLPLAFVSFLTIGVPFIVTSRLPSFFQSTWFPRLSQIIEGIVVLGIALCIIGKEGRKTARNSIRPPDLRWPLLALAVPISIDIFISVGQYILDRAQWAAHDFAKFAPPRFGPYFNVPDMWFLLLIFSAFCEEVIFRGLLQTHFIRRYGMYRGIFLVGIVWAAFHFFSDFSFSHFTGQEALVQLCFRIFTCAALNFVLAWFTLRSESVVPAAIAHGLYNMLVYSPIGPQFAGKDVLRVASWAILAYVLFRYWPFPSEIKLKTVATTERPEPVA